MLTLAIHLITGYKGQSFWAVNFLDCIPHSVISMLPAEVVAMASELKLGGFVANTTSVLILTLSFFMLLRTIITTRQLFKPVAEWFTIIVIIATEVFWFQLDLYRDFQGLILVNFGLLSSLVACKLIICSVAKVLY